MEKNLKDYKERAKRLRNALSLVLNINCTQSQAYELLAKEENYPNWDSLSGTIKKNENVIDKDDKSQILTIEEQILQLFLIKLYLNESFSIISILSNLQNQHNIEMNKLWLKVNIDNNPSLYSLFSQADFFDSEIRNILISTSFTSAIEPTKNLSFAIDFLKMKLSLNK